MGKKDAHFKVNFETLPVVEKKDFKKQKCSSFCQLSNKPNRSFLAFLVQTQCPLERKNR